ncbi:MAG: DUF4437 domain-containing protein [Pseudomonadota bacterium]
MTFLRKTSMIVAALVATHTAASATADPITLLEAGDAVWQTTPEGVEFASLQGDRFMEAYQALVRLPAGTVSPLHVKTANMFGVMLQGEMVHYADHEDPQAARRIGPGAFYSIAAGTAHISACVSSIPCVTYLYQDGAFDFLPVQP